MTKKGPLGMTEKFWIEEHSDKMSPKDMAKKLDRAITLVEKYVLQYHKTRFKAGGKLGRQEGAVVMTEAASMTGDDERTGSKRARPECITKIKDV